jgi:alpha-beta hydrolase superfamily lysophospholipase
VTSGSLVKELKADETNTFVREKVHDKAGQVVTARWLAADRGEIVAPRARDEVEQEPVTLKSGPLTLEGTLWRPRGEGPFAAMALVHGSGPMTRDGLFLRARELARRGFAVLAFDKRGTGRGDVRWENATFTDLADDALAAVLFLKGCAGVDGARVGLQGDSQAGWIIPMAAARSSAVSFAVVVSGGGVAPADQEIYRARAQTVRHGLPASEADAAAAFMQRKRDFAFSGTGWETYAAAARAAAAKPWFEFVNGPLVPDQAFWRDWQSYKDYDAGAWIGKMRQPVLVLLGGEDDTVPSAEAARIWNETLRAAKHPDFTVRILPGFGHALFTRETKGGVELVQEAFDALVDWLTPHVGRAGGHAPAPALH